MKQYFRHFQVVSIEKKYVYIFQISDQIITSKIAKQGASDFTTLF